MSQYALPDPPACTPYASKIPNAYGYQPSLAPGIVFVVLFTTSAIAHAIQAWMNRRRSQTPWLWFFVIGAIYEDIGWCGMLGSHWCAYSGTLFEMQISSLIGGKSFQQLHHILSGF